MSTSSIDLRYVCFEVSTPGAAFNGMAMIIYTTIKQQQHNTYIHAEIITLLDRFDGSIVGLVISYVMTTL